MTAEFSPPSPFTETTGRARHAAITALAESGPVQRITVLSGNQMWLVTGYTEVRELLAHPAVVKDHMGVPHPDSTPEDLRAAAYTHLLTTNPPDHTRLRKLVSAAFTLRRVQALRPQIQKITDALLDELGRAGSDGSPVDLVAGLSYPLPITVIAEMLGVPIDDRDTFREWSSIVVHGALYPAKTYVKAVRDLVDYVRELIAAKRRAPTGDLLSALIDAHDGGDRLSEDELSSMVFLLLVAGHETTVNLISGTAHSLLSHPDQLRLVHDEPDRLPAAIEEQFRHDGPLQVAIPSVTTADVTIGGVTIPAGEFVVPSLLAANRDSTRFPEADRFDVTRERTPHMAFGHGLHHCLGAPLARLEGVIAIGSLLERFPDLRLADQDTDPNRYPSFLMNGIVNLPVILH